MANIVGKQFGRLIVIAELVQESREFRAPMLCVCDCGEMVILRRNALVTGGTASCGCWYREARCVGGAKNVRHGHTRGGRSLTFKAWAQMRRRCRNPKSRSFHYYGGRGIAVCERWGKFENFLADMGERPSARHSLDRIDSNGNYEAGNCRWATDLEQNRNRSITRRISFNGQTKTLKEWADETGIAYKTLHQRIRCGWLIERALQQ